jgi:transcription antitermination factor NusG
MENGLSNFNQGSWFAVQVRPRSEKTVAMNLEGKGYQHFLPTRTVDSSKAKRKSDEPLFPGYVFCRLDSKLPGRVVTTPGVVRILGYGNAFSAVPDSEIETIRTIAKSSLPVNPHPYLHQGDYVRICEGPLSGIEGKIVSLQSKNLLVVSVTLLQRAVAVEIDTRAVAPIEQERSFYEIKH